MKSVKPGRAPSAIGVWGAVVAVLFGIFWTAKAASIDSSGVFPFFGILFILSGIIAGVYNYKNATGKNRYSSFDITEDGEEPDPLERRFGSDATPLQDTQADTPGFCPYCGAPAEVDYDFCRKCGKRLPQ